MVVDVLIETVFQSYKFGGVLLPRDFCAAKPNLVPRASVAFPQKASRPADISCDAVHLEQELKWP